MGYIFFSLTLYYRCRPLDGGVTGFHILPTRVQWMVLLFGSIYYQRRATGGWCCNCKYDNLYSTVGGTTLLGCFTRMLAVSSITNAQDYRSSTVSTVF